MCLYAGKISRADRLSSLNDDVSVREALASLIGSVALHVECFATPAEFLHRARNDNPSCVVLDVRMPGLSGLEVQQRLAHSERKMPVIFISRRNSDIPDGRARR